MLRILSLTYLWEHNQFMSPRRLLLRNDIFQFFSLFSILNSLCIQTVSSACLPQRNSPHILYFGSLLIHNIECKVNFSEKEKEKKNISFKKTSSGLWKNNDKHMILKLFYVNMIECQMTCHSNESIFNLTFIFSILINPYLMTIQMIKKQITTRSVGGLYDFCLPNTIY